MLFQHYRHDSHEPILRSVYMGVPVINYEFWHLLNGFVPSAIGFSFYSVTIKS